MKNRARKLFLSALAGTLTTLACAQVPDAFTSFDPGGSSMGMGGALQVTGNDTLSSYFNPAGLGYLVKRQVALNYRNLPETKSFSTGTLAPAGRLLTTDGISGSKKLTHFGVAMPLSDVLRGSKGVVGLAYTVGGYMSDKQLSNSLTVSSSLNVVNYELARSAQTNYYSLAYGISNQAQTVSFGAGVNFVRQDISFMESGTFSDQSGAYGSTTPLSDTGHGVGFTVGLQGVPKSSPNVSWGLSYRSRVDLSGNANTKSLFDRIPSRAMAGIAFRNDNVRGGKDYIVMGAQVARYMDGEQKTYFDRANQTTTSFGIEYDLVHGAGRIPIRVGYQAIPTGGAGFADRNAVTYGIGYRPENAKFALDLSFAAPQGGGFDSSISLNYRFEK